MSDHRALTAVEPDQDDLPVLVPDRAPAMKGGSVDAIDYVCFRCREVLVASVNERQIMDVAIRCSTCGAVGVTPPLPEGEPLGPAAVAGPGTYRLSDTVDLGETGCFASQRTAERRDTERGSLLRQTAAPEPPRELSPQFLADLVQRVRGLMGADFYRAWQTYQRGVTSDTPAANPHRLMACVHAVEEAIARRSDESWLIDPIPVVELLISLDLLDSWRRNPNWSEIRSGLTDPNQYAHDIGLLAVATYLTDVGNDAGFIPSGDSDSRSADLHIAATPTDRVRLEVKAPQALQGSRPP